jgi:hypothetical protein
VAREGRTIESLQHLPHLDVVHMEAGVAGGSRRGSRGLLLVALRARVAAAALVGIAADVVVEEVLVEAARSWLDAQSGQGWMGRP